MVVVLVGALNVSSISTFAHGEIASGAAREWHEPRERAVAQGDEIGRFNMGSTVIVLFGPQLAQLEPIAPGAAMRLGQRLGRCGPPPA
jgi:phosphatidylserine decarboxylase